MTAPPRPAAPPALEPPSRPLSPWQLLYGAAHRLRCAWYRDRAAVLPRPVISIGNLHWGGTGKTPLTAAVAAHLRDRGHRVCILSRGYGGTGRGVRVVSDGGPPLLDPETAGDEPVLLAGELPGVAVVVAPKRAEGGRHALRHLVPPPEVFVLDDGFSHLPLARDLDLLAFPAADPFAGGRLLPTGRLREPLGAVARAQAVLLTGLPPETLDGPAPGDAGRKLAAALAPHGFTGPGFACVLAAGPPRRVDPGGADGEPLATGTRVLLVSAIARPERFAATAEVACRQAGLEIAGHLPFRDHHPYPPESLERIRRTAAANGATVVLATAKDRVKLRGRLDLPLAELPVRAEPEGAFWRWLDPRLDDLLGKRPAPPPEELP